MNRVFTVLSAVLLSISIGAQAPQSFSYQAVVRGANNAFVVNKQVGVRVSILHGSEFGASIYVESHTPTTNANGLVSLSIGLGKIINGTFSSLDWSKGPYFVKTETDVEGGVNYQLTSLSELMSVPYALYAANSKPGPKGDSGLPGKDGLQGPMGSKGEIGYQGLKGDKGDIGAQGPVGNFPSGTTKGEMKYWDGTNWLSLTPVSNGQILTNCDGIPTWTTGGICYGKIAFLNCSGVLVDGSLNNGDVVSNVSIGITYSGGNGGSYSSQSISSTGVLGLTANLQAGTFLSGSGNLTLTVSGTPTSVGNALFSLNIAGQICSVSMLVQDKLGIPGPNITDVEGNSYKSVIIGKQTWMAENLKVTKYNDGTPIPNITDNTEWSKLTTGAWSYYKNDVVNNSKYGKLYNWYTVSKTTNGNQNVCPKGWHVPSDLEWTALTDYLGGENFAGGKMKEVGITSWYKADNCASTNTSLFSALPGGYRLNIGYCDSIGNGGLASWWSSSEGSLVNAWYRSLFYYNCLAFRNEIDKRSGFSVRCLKD